MTPVERSTIACSPRTGWRRVLLTALAAVAAAAAPAAPLPAQAGGVISGVVIDARTQRPLAAAQVAVEGRTAGTTTNEAGQFRLTNVPGTQVTIIVRRVGYRGITEPNVAVGRTDLRLLMTEAPRLLEQMVVTGTAEPVERRALGHAVTTVDAAAVQQTAPVPNTASLINGRAPGVVMVGGSGAIGASPRFRIRGASSLSLSDQPLVYIDGVRMANDISTGPNTQFFGSAVVSRLNDINPDDIESIEVIKGPAAATLYGTEANNGVIQIITKRGRAGRNTFTLDTRAGTNYFNDAQERIGYNINRNPVTGQLQRWSAVEQEDARGTPLFKTGRTQQYNLSLSGGSDMVRYFLSSGYENTTGIEPTNDLWRYSGRANVTIAPTKTFDITTSVGITQQNIHLPLEAGGGMWFSAYFGQAPLTASDSLRRGYFSAPPEAFWNAFENYQRVARTTSSITLNHRPLEWFTHRLIAGYDQTGEDNVGLTQRMGPELRQFFTSPLDQQGGKTSRRRELTVASVDYGATARAQLPRGIIASTSAGAQFFRRNTYQLQARGEGFAAAGQSVVSATALTFGNEEFVSNSTLGFYAQEQLSFGERFYLTAGLRVDDNSAFGSNFSWVQYPKFAASWVVSEEPWYNLGFLNTFKLRAAYGESGQQPATNSALRTYVAVTGGDGASAVTPSTLGNPDLRPERGKEVEVGFDASALNDRLSFEFSAYRRNTEDAILSAPVSPSTGFAGTRFTNIGLVRTQGVELQTRLSALQRENVGLDFTLNVSRNDNEIRDLGGPEFIGTGNIRQQVGYPVGSYWDLRVVSAEFTSDGRTRNAMCDDGKGGVTACLTASGAAAAPRVFYGRTDPANEGSLSSTLSLFRRFRVYGLVDWKTGQTQFNNNVRARCQIFRLCPENFEPLKYDPVLIAQYDSPNILRNFVYGDASFAKLREVSLSYTLPTALSGRLGASNGSLTLSGRNLHTWTKWKGVDPEAFFVVEQFARLEQAQVPPLRQFLVSMNLTF
jgi:TonB-linked SusC/RagA family outer membrane protein